jgi:hypothetical protein
MFNFFLYLVVDIFKGLESDDQFNIDPSPINEDRIVGRVIKAISNLPAPIVSTVVNSNLSSDREPFFNSTFLRSFFTTVIDSTFSKLGISGMASSAPLIGVSLGNLCVSVVFTISTACYVKIRVSRRIDAVLGIKSVTNPNHPIFRSNHQQLTQQSSGQDNNKQHQLGLLD